MSDLYCPARIVIFLGGVEEHELDRLGAQLSRERVAAVYTSGDKATARSGTVVAGALRLTAEAVGDLRTDPHVALADIADRHRGETVVVVAESTVIGRLPELGGLVPSDAGLATVEIDADGWRLR